MGTGRPVEESAFEYALLESGPIDLDTTFLQPNVEDVDGVAAYAHVTPADMPLRIAVGYPRVPARYGSKPATRDVAIEAMRMWQDAIQPLVPWFELAFIEKDPSAPVQIVWKSRIIGPWGGFGGVRHWMEGTELRVGVVTEIDALTFAALVKQPNGMRVDGRPLILP